MYWSTLETFYNGQKIPAIPLLVNNNVVSDFKAKYNAPFTNTRYWPVSQYLATHAKLSSVNFNDEDVLRTIRKSDQNKAHKQDDISIRITLCEKTLLKPHSLLHQQLVRH